MQRDDDAVEDERSKRDGEVVEDNPASVTASAHGLEPRKVVHHSHGKTALSIVHVGTIGLSLKGPVDHADDEAKDGGCEHDALRDDTELHPSGGFAPFCHLSIISRHGGHTPHVDVDVSQAQGML